MPNASKLSADSGLVRYGSAVAAIALATVLQLLLQPVLGNSAPFAMSVIAVAVVARYGGLGPAIVALALGAVAVAYFILPPRGTFEVRGLENQIKLAMYVFVAIRSPPFKGKSQPTGIWPNDSIRRRRLLNKSLTAIRPGRKQHSLTHPAAGYSSAITSVLWLTTTNSSKKEATNNRALTCDYRRA